MSDLVVEILEGAAALIQDGWCRRFFSDEIFRLTKNGPIQHTCYCAEGAIKKSFCSRAKLLSDAEKFVAECSANEARRLLINRIMGRFGNKYSALIGTKGHYSIIASFNDDESVSREEVLAVFRDAITMAYRNSAEVPQLLLTHEVSA